MPTDIRTDGQPSDPVNNKSSIVPFDICNPKNHHYVLCFMSAPDVNFDVLLKQTRTIYSLHPLLVRKCRNILTLFRSTLKK